MASRDELTKEQMARRLEILLEAAPGSDIYELAELDKDVNESPVWALAVLETMERSGQAERIGTSFINPRNFLWRLVRH